MPATGVVHSLPKRAGRVAAATSCLLLATCAPQPEAGIAGESGLSSVAIPEPPATKPGIADLSSYRARQTGIAPGTILSRFASDALAANAARSAAEGAVAQRISEQAALVWERRPSLQPVAELRSDGTSAAGVGLTYTAVDFGRGESRTEQAAMAVIGARIDRWEEHNAAVRDTLLHLVDAAEARELLRLSRESQEALRKLLALARTRVAAGVADRSETELVSLRVSELQSATERDRADLQLSLALLNSTIDRRAELDEIPGFAEVALAIRPAPTKGILPPAVARADVRQRIAELRVRQVEAERLPRVVLGARAVHDGDEAEAVGSLSLDNSFSQLFAASDNVRAARAARASAEASAFRTRHEVEAERGRLRLDRIRLEAQQASLRRLVEQSHRSAALFEDQQAVGARPLTDGITVLRTLLDAERDLASAESSLLRARILLAGVEGRLTAPVIDR